MPYTKLKQHGNFNIQYFYMCIKVATHACVKEYDVIDTKLYSCLSPLPKHEAGKSLVCQRKSSDIGSYASSLQLFCETILLLTIFQGSCHGVHQ